MENSTNQLQTFLKKLKEKCQEREKDVFIGTKNTGPFTYDIKVGQQLYTINLQTRSWMIVYQAR